MPDPKEKADRATMDGLVLKAALAILGVVAGGNVGVDVYDRYNKPASSNVEAIAQRLEEGQAKLWERHSALEIQTRTEITASRMETINNAKDITTLIEAQKNTTANIDRLANAVDKMEDRFDGRIREIERKTP